MVVTNSIETIQMISSIIILHSFSGIQVKIQSLLRVLLNLLQRQTVIMTLDIVYVSSDPLEEEVCVLGLQSFLAGV